MWSHGEEEIPCFADQNLQSSQNLEDQSPTGQKSSFGNIYLLKGHGKTRVVAG